MILDDGEWTNAHKSLLESQRKARDTINKLNELIEVVASEWNNITLTCACDATKEEACSICEISARLETWQDQRDAERSQS